MTIYFITYPDRNDEKNNFQIYIFDNKSLNMPIIIIHVI